MKDLQRGYVNQFAENLTVKRTIQLVVVQFAAMHQNSVPLMATLLCRLEHHFS